MGKNNGRDKKPLNCWEYMSCGRGPDGSNKGQLEICLAATEERLDLVHGGKNGGRTCWAIAWSSARKKVGGTFAKKDKDCKNCNFFKIVKTEEGRYFWPEGLLLKILRK